MNIDEFNLPATVGQASVTKTEEEPGGQLSGAEMRQALVPAGTDPSDDSYLASLTALGKKVEKARTSKGKASQQRSPGTSSISAIAQSTAEESVRSASAITSLENTVSSLVTAIKTMNEQARSDSKAMLAAVNALSTRLEASMREISATVASPTPQATTLVFNAPQRHAPIMPEAPIGDTGPTPNPPAEDEWVPMY